jgi:CheY-like chemotaxis protein
MPPNPSQALPATPSPETAKPALLVVEDSQTLSNIIQQRLSPDFQVKAAMNGEDALRLLKEGHGFAAVLLDLVLPRVDGFEVMRRLRDRGDTTPILVITARPRQTIEKETLALGATGIYIKPLDFASITEDLKRIIVKQKRGRSGELVVNEATGKNYPLRRSTKCCFICGFEKVRIFTPVAEGFKEDWSKGAFPVYQSKPPYENWDFLKTLIMVCPYCFFSSADAADFAERADSVYPFSEESKKILARNISVRKRLVPEALDVDPRFDEANRTKEQVIDTLVLADKCCNGLILAGKAGSYAMAGIYSTLLGALHHPFGEKYYREAFNHFENQLKDKNTPRAVLVKTYYFCIVLHMLLGRTAMGRDIMRKVEQMYADRKLEDVGEEERDWLMRINHVWKNGVETGSGRDIV